MNLHMSIRNSNLYNTNKGGLPWCLSSKESGSQCSRHRFDPWVRKVTWGRKWQPTPISLPGKSQGQMNLVGYSPWGHTRVGLDFVTKQQKQQNIIP